MKKLLIFAELVFTIVGLLIYSEAVLKLVISGGAQENELLDYDGSLIRIINFLLYTVTFLLLVLRWRKTISILNKDRLLISALVLLPVFSIIWSFEKASTLKDSFGLFGSSLFGVYLATRYSFKQQLQLLAWAFGIQMLLSVVFAVALPKYAIMSGIHQGKWRGVFVHKNILGARMTLSGIVFLILSNTVKRGRLIAWCGFAFSLLLLFLSTSSSSLINLLIIILLFYIFQTLRWSYQFMVPTLMAIASIGGSLYFWLISNIEILYNAIGKDATLTGRTELWPLVMEMIWKQPWLGYGFGGFWQGFNGESAYIWRAVGWTPTHPHNGFLALWLNLGLLGLLIFLLGFWRSSLKAVAFARFSKTPEGIWPIIYLTYIVFSNITESNLMESNRLIWVLYIATTLSLLIVPVQPNKKVSQFYSIRIGA